MTTTTEPKVIPETCPFCGDLAAETLHGCGGELVVALGGEMDRDRCVEGAALKVHLGSGVLRWGGDAGDGADIPLSSGLGITANESERVSVLWWGIWAESRTFL